MSRTKKGNSRDPFDFYSTPSWCVDRLLEKVTFTPGNWIEPTAGNGAIIKALLASPKLGQKPTNIVAVELQDRFEEELKALVPNVFIQDYLSFDYSKVSSQKASLAIGNPPYKMALPIIQHAMTQAETVCVLLRINFLASEARADWMKKNVPDVYVLPNRPKFINNGSDACEYGWFVWGPGSSGKITILDTTSKAERKTRQD